jgi:putative DNA primase/helicase
VLIVGKSSKARKGTAEITARELFKRSDALLRQRLGTKDLLRFHAGGLSTGEGLAYAIRDAKDNDEKQ